MLLKRPARLVAAQHVAGLLAGHRVSQERNSIREPVVATVAAALIAALIANDGCRANGAGDAILAYRVPEVAACPGYQRCAQPLNGLLVEHV